MVRIIFATPGVRFPNSLRHFDVQLTCPTPSPARTRQATLYGVPHRPVRVAILGINYAPEPTGIAPYTTGLAAGLAERGHDVHVFTGYPHYPRWKRDEGTSGFRSDEHIDGVRVRRLSHYVPRDLSWVGRAAMELTFGLQLLTTRWGRPEVVLCVTPPLLATAMSTIRARLSWRRPVLGILIQDLYSRGVAETGAVSGFSARAVCVVEGAAIRLADGIAVIHAGFTTELAEHLGVDVRRIREIRNWTHVDPPDPSASAAFRDAYHWGADEVVVLHAGNMGYKQGLENVIAAAELAGRSNSRARFVLLGDGNQRAHLEAAAVPVYAALEFLPPVTEEEFPSCPRGRRRDVGERASGGCADVRAEQADVLFQIRQADPGRDRCRRVHRWRARRLGCRCMRAS